MTEQARRRILVVDDDVEIVSLVSLRLGKRGYDVTSAGDGATALAAARQLRPDLVLLDVMMPGMSGWEVTRALKGDPLTEGIKIILVTAIGAQVAEATTPVTGADAHVDKPFEFSTLEATIDRLLA
ncbi:MAG: response regulator [Kofleriaceae bacterium]